MPSLDGIGGNKMHCDCCDKLLEDAEATAKFVDADGTATRYVGMCKKCREFLPKEIKISHRHDLERVDVNEEPDDYFDLGDY
jgi:hypothetical protein